MQAETNQDAVHPDLFLSLHTADPGEDGSNEATYAGYARLAVPRADFGMAAGRRGQPPKPERYDWEPCTERVDIRVTHAAVRRAQTGPAEVLLTVNMIPPVKVSIGVIVRLIAPLPAVED